MVGLRERREGLLIWVHGLDWLTALFPSLCGRGVCGQVRILRMMESFSKSSKKSGGEGINFSPVDRWGLTPLMEAEQNGQAKTASLLKKVLASA